MCDWVSYVTVMHALRKNDAESEKEDAIALFDMLPIEDSRIFDLSARAGQPSPYLLLQVVFNQDFTC